MAICGGVQDFMAVPRFYCPDTALLIQGGQLPNALVRHAIQARRLREGEHLVLFDGSGGEYRTHLTCIDREIAMIAPGEFCSIERESPLQICLIQALCATDKMDWVIQKAVELGVHSLIVVALARSVVQLSGERMQRRLDHWMQVMVSAAEQCGRNRLPSLRFCADLDEMVSWLPDGVRLMLDPEGRQELSATIVPDQAVTLWVGPEGGMSEGERAWSIRQGFVAVQVGPRVLRTETAGLAALAALQFGYGDWMTRHVGTGERVSGVAE